MIALRNILNKQQKCVEDEYCDLTIIIILKVGDSGMSFTQTIHAKKEKKWENVPLIGFHCATIKHVISAKRS